MGDLTETVFGQSTAENKLLLSCAKTEEPTVSRFVRQAVLNQSCVWNRDGLESLSLAGTKKCGFIPGGHEGAIRGSIPAWPHRAHVLSIVG